MGKVPNVAEITLERRPEERSAIITPTHTEIVRGFTNFEFTPTHIVFTLLNGTIFAYRADRVIELKTYLEE